MTLPTTYDGAEKHEYEGTPVELYVFSQEDVVWRWTSSETLAADFDGWDYIPYPISRSEIEQSQEDRTGSLEVMVPQDNPIAQMFAETVPVLPIGLIIYRIHRVLGVDTADLQTVIFVGKVSAVTFSDGKATISCLPVSAVLRKAIPWPIYQSQCNWALYGVSCGINPGTYNSAKVVSMSGPHPGGWMVTFEGAPWADGLHSAGYARRELNGDMKMIVADNGTYVWLMSPFRNPDLALGETLTLYQGCDRQHTTCLVKFGNLDNFMGFPFVPLKNPYTGSIA